MSNFILNNMKKTIKIAHWSQINCIYLPLYLAIDQGIFDQYDIKIELVPTGNDDDIYRAVMSGISDIGLGDPTFCVMPFQKNKRSDIQSRIIAEICSRVALWGITHNPVIHDIQSETDLVGLRLGCFPSPSTSHTLLQAAKATNKRLLKSMEIIQAPIGQQSDLLLSNKADIALYIEPFISIAEERGWRVVYNAPQIYKEYAFSALYSSTKFIAENPKIIDAVQKALQQALDILHQSPEIGVQIAQKLFPELKPSILKRAVKRCLRDKIWPQTIFPSSNGWAQAIETRQKAGYNALPNAYDIEALEHKT